MGKGEQLDLFRAEEPKPDLGPALSEEWARAAACLPAHVRVGTSSWTFPGWQGLVYQRRYPNQKVFTRESLREYAAHPLMSTVGVDRSHYAPLTREDWHLYAGQLPSDFRCVIKVWDAITTLVYPDHARYGDRRGKPNADFLNAELFTSEVAAPLLDTFAAHAGPLVLEVPPMRRPPAARVFEDALEQFLQKAPPELHYAVELRNPTFFTDRYLDILHAHAASHVLNFHTLMPTVGEQLQRRGVLPGPAVVTRLLLPPYTGYAQRKQDFRPFDQLRERHPQMRADVVRLAQEAAEKGHTVYVIVNNKAEGCAPLSLLEMAMGWPS